MEPQVVLHDEAVGVSRHELFGQRRGHTVQPRRLWHEQPDIALQTIKGAGAELEFSCENTFLE